MIRSRVSSTDSTATMDPLDLPEGVKVLSHQVAGHIHSSTCFGKKNYNEFYTRSPTSDYCLNYQCKR